MGGGGRGTGVRDAWGRPGRGGVGAGWWQAQGHGSQPSSSSFGDVHVTTHPDDARPPLGTHGLPPFPGPHAGQQRADPPEPHHEAGVRDQPPEDGHPRHCLQSRHSLHQPRRSGLEPVSGVVVFPFRAGGGGRGWGHCGVTRAGLRCGPGEHRTAVPAHRVPAARGCETARGLCGGRHGGNRVGPHAGSLGRAGAVRVQEEAEFGRTPGGKGGFPGGRRLRGACQARTSLNGVGGTGQRVQGGESGRSRGLGSREGFVDGARSLKMLWVGRGRRGPACGAVQRPFLV